MPVPLPDLPPDNTTICLVIPDSPQWRQIYMGALVLLQKWWYYDVEDAESAENVVQRVMECSYLTSQNYEGCKEVTCETLNDCIENNEDTRNLLQSLIYSENYDDVRALAQETVQGDLAEGGNPTCDADTWFGGVLELVQRMNQINVDQLEIWEAATNELEIFADVIGGITGIDETSIDAVLAWIAQMQEQVQENYLAQYTQAYEDTVACDLFCLALNQCALTPSMIFDYFAGRLGATLTIESLLSDILNYLAGGEWSGTQVVDFMMLAQVAYRSALGFFGDNMAFKDFALALKVGFRSPSDAWEVLCDECPSDWEHTFIFDNTLDSIWTILEGVQETDYIRSVLNVGLNEQSLQIYANFAEETHITSIDFQDYFTNNRVGSNNEVIAFSGTAYPYSTLLTQYQVSTFNEPITQNWIGDLTTNGLRVRLVTRNSAQARMLQMIVRGDGFDPFI